MTTEAKVALCIAVAVLIFWFSYLMAAGQP